jgi:hypothetical protein
LEILSKLDGIEEFIENLTLFIEDGFDFFDHSGDLLVIFFTVYFESYEILLFVLIDEYLVIILKHFDIVIEILSKVFRIIFVHLEKV